MAFKFGFFNAKNLDRTYTAEDFTEYLSSMICNGILDTYGENFSLTASSGLRVTLGTGKAWLNGHYFVNDSAYSINLSDYMDESLPRYVCIVITCDTSESGRAVTLDLISGTPAENPAIPDWQSREETKTRLLLYAVRLNPDRNYLTKDDWFDYRDDSNVCGYCRCILGKCRVSEMLDEMVHIRQIVDTLNQNVTELQHYVFNTADKIKFSKDDDGNLYYLNSKGNRLTGDVKINGVPYAFNANGNLLTGFRTVFGKRYYYDTTTGNIQLDWVELDDKKYYITLLDGMMMNQYRTIDGVCYWFDMYGVATPQGNITFPDANGDGIVNSADTAIISKFTASCGSGQYENNMSGWVQYLTDEGISNPESIAFPDADGDGTINSNDTAMVSAFASACGSGKYANTMAGWMQFLADRNGG